MTVGGGSMLYNTAEVLLIEELFKLIYECLNFMLYTQLIQSYPLIIEHHHVT